MNHRHPQKQAEYHRLLGHLIDTSIDLAAFVVDFNGSVATWNMGAAEIFGFSETEMIGQAFVTLFTAEDRLDGLPQRQMATTLKEGRTAGEGWYVKKDGSRAWMSGSMALIRDENSQPRSFGVILRESTEAKRAAEVLQEREKRQNLALDAAGVGTWFWHIGTGKKAYDLLILDSGLRRLIGLDPSANSDCALTELIAAIHPDDQVVVRREFERCRKQGGALQVEFRIALPDGTVRRLKKQGRSSTIEKGLLQLIAGACFDITQTKVDDVEHKEADRK